MNSKSKYSTAVKVVGFIITMLAVSQAAKYFKQPHASPSNLIKDYIQKTSPSLPRMLDKTTRLDRLTQSDNKLVYHYTILDITHSSLQAIPNLTGVIKDIGDGIKKQMCATPATRHLLDAGITLESEYKTADAASTFCTVSVSAADCNK